LFALLRCANISAITPVPVPISKMLNGLFSIGVQAPTKRHQYQFSWRSDLVQENCLNWNLDMKTKSKPLRN
jgi:hypothetical protein